MLMPFGTGRSIGTFNRSGRNLTVGQCQSTWIHRGFQGGDFVHRRKLTSSVNHFVDRTTHSFLSPQLRTNGSTEIFDKKVLRENQFELRGDEKCVVVRLFLFQFQSDGIGIEPVVFLTEIQTCQIFTKTIQSRCMWRRTTAILWRRLRTRIRTEMVRHRIGGGRGPTAFTRGLITNKRREIRVFHFGDRLDRLKIKVSRLRQVVRRIISRRRAARRWLETEIVMIGRIVLKCIFEIDVQLNHSEEEDPDSGEKDFLSYRFGSFQFGLFSHDRRIR